MCQREHKPSYRKLLQIVIRERRDGIAFQAALHAFVEFAVLEILILAIDLFFSTFELWKLGNSTIKIPAGVSSVPFSSLYTSMA